MEVWKFSDKKVSIHHRPALPRQSPRRGCQKSITPARQLSSKVKSAPKEIYPLQQSGVVVPRTVGEQLHRNVQRFRGGLVSKAHRLLYHLTLGLRAIKKNKKKYREHAGEASPHPAPFSFAPCSITPLLALPSAWTPHSWGRA